MDEYRISYEELAGKEVINLHLLLADTLVLSDPTQWIRSDDPVTGDIIYRRIPPPQ